MAGRPGYAVRRVHNGLIDRHPALIARCHGVADVVDAVRLARTNGLDVSIRGGGHNVGGRATIDDGLMIDLSPMKGIHVDPRVCTVRAEGACCGKSSTARHSCKDWPRPAASSEARDRGPHAGRRTWLADVEVRLALDNLRSADLVMADGRVVRASVDENPDLFWAIRGGGGNFGIAVSLEYLLHSVGPMITGGVVAHPVQRAADVLRFYRDTCLSLPDEATLFAALQTAPDGVTKVAGLVGSHCGPLEQGEAAFRRLKAFGAPVMDAMGPIPYTTLNGMLDPAFPKGALNYWNAQFLTDLSDDAIRTLIEALEECPSPMSAIVIEHFHGAASRVPKAATACTLRVNGFDIVIASQWTDPNMTERGIKWARDTYAALTPYLAPTRFVNYLEDEVFNAAAVVYGENLPRLRAIKTKYDPDNFFRQNVNILPG